jgi:hypothetical protein
MKGLIPLLCGTLLFAPPSGADVYRWQADDGTTHFGDSPPGDRPFKRLDGLEPALSGKFKAEARGLRPGERRALQRLERAERKPAARRSVAAADRRETRRRCSESRSRIDNISATLRRGYKPARGARLQRRRRELEAWVFDHCDTGWR